MIEFSSQATKVKCRDAATFQNDNSPRFAVPAFTSTRNSNLKSRSIKLSAPSAADCIPDNVSPQGFGVKAKGESSKCQHGPAIPALEQHLPRSRARLVVRVARRGVDG